MKKVGAPGGRTSRRHFGLKKPATAQFARVEAIATRVEAIA